MYIKKMETIDNDSEKKEIWGRVFVTHNEKFGYCLLLCIKYPAKSWFDKTCFVQLHNSDCNVLTWDSVKSDVIMKEFGLQNLISAKVYLNLCKKKLS